MDQPAISPLRRALQAACAPPAQLPAALVDCLAALAEGGAALLLLEPGEQRLKAMARAPEEAPPLVLPGREAPWDALLRGQALSWSPAGPGPLPPGLPSEWGRRTLHAWPLQQRGRVLGALLVSCAGQLPEEVGWLAARARDALAWRQERRDLSDRAEWLRDAFEAVGVGTWDWDVVGGAVSWSDEVPPLFGFALGDFDGRYETYLALIHPDDRPAVEQAVARSLSGESPDYVVEHRVCLADGRERWLECRGRASYAGDGRPLRLRGTVTDVTQRKEAEEALRREQRLLAATFSTSAMAVTVLDPQGNIVLANDRAERILGLQRSLLLERRYDSPAWRSTAPDGGPWPDAEQPFRRVLDGGQAVYDVRHAIEWPDGSRRQLSVSGAPVKDVDGRISLVVFSIVDVTEREATAAALRLSDERFRHFFEQGAIGMAISAPPAGILAANQALCRVLGCDLDTLRQLSWIGLTHPEDLPASIAGLERLVSGEIDSFTQDKRFVRPDGTVVPTRIWVQAQRDPAGRAERFFTLIQDLTEQRRLEAELLHAAKLEAVGRLAGGVAHDFNNLLTVMLAHLHLLERQLPGREGQELLLECRTAAERAGGLTRQLLTFARRQPLSPRLLRLNGVVEGVLPLLRRITGTALELQLELDPSDPAVHADPAQLEQIVLNLGANAVDASPQGGRLTISTRSEALGPDGASGAPGRWVALSLRDQGQGMSEEIRRRACEPFFTTKPPGQGTGLGLSICHEVARQLGGALELESALGVGTTVRILLPRAAGDEAPALATAPQPSVPGRAEAILVVEDEAAVRKAVSQSLLQLGYRVTAVGLPEEALERIRAGERYQLLFSDVGLPGLDGRRLAVEVVRLSPGTRVLLTSGYNEPLAPTPGEPPPPPARFLAKPYGLDELAAAVRSVLDEPALQLEAEA